MLLSSTAVGDSGWITGPGWLTEGLCTQSKSARAGVADLRNLMKFRSSNAAPLAALVLCMSSPAIALGVVEPAHRPAIVLGVALVCAMGVVLLRVDSFDVNKKTNEFHHRRYSVLGGKQVTLSLRDVAFVNIKHRSFGGGYRSGNPYAFQLAVTMASGEEIALTGWTDSLRTQDQGFALADFIGVPFNTTA
jgi:hypothetical protein